MIASSASEAQELWSLATAASMASAEVDKARARQRKDAA